MKPVLVTWRDIRSDDGWRDMEDLDTFIEADNTIVHQVGFLYEQNEEQVVLLDSHFANRELFGGVHKIPRGCIIDIKELTYI